MRFGSITTGLATRMLKYYRISYWKGPGVRYLDELLPVGIKELGVLEVGKVRVQVLEDLVVGGPRGPGTWTSFWR